MGTKKASKQPSKKAHKKVTQKKSTPSPSKGQKPGKGKTTRSDGSTTNRPPQG